MSPRPAPDLDQRRDQVLQTTRALAESGGWPTVTMRRLAGELGVTQPVLYSVFAGRQALIDAVAVDGFADLASTLEAAEPSPRARMRAYLQFATAHPAVYDAMFSMPSGLEFAAGQIPEPLERSFAAIREVFPDADGTRAEVAWATLHGLATLQAGGRLRATHKQARVDLADELFSRLDGQ
jgi:AcrR family transcriptional regulator